MANCQRRNMKLGLRLLVLACLYQVINADGGLPAEARLGLPWGLEIDFDPAVSDSSVDADLHDLLEKCKRDGLGSIHLSTFNTPTKAGLREKSFDCDAATYAQQLLDERARLSLKYGEFVGAETIKSEGEGSNTNENAAPFTSSSVDLGLRIRTGPVAHLRETPSFKDFFRLYELPSNPVILQDKHDIGIPMPLFESCLGHESSSRVSSLGEYRSPTSISEVSLPRNCSHLLGESFRVPSLMVNDYIQRIRARQNALSDWPHLLTIRGTQAGLRRCPLDMHMLLIPLRGRMELMVVPDSEADWLTIFRARQDASATAERFNWTQKHLDKSIIEEVDLFGLLEKTQKSAENTQDDSQSARGFEMLEMESKKDILEENEVLFAPSGTWVTWKYSMVSHTKIDHAMERENLSQSQEIQDSTSEDGQSSFKTYLEESDPRITNEEAAVESEVAESSDAHLALQFCFVDASNFHAVKQAIKFRGLVDHAFRSVHVHLQDRSFDISMEREPLAQLQHWHHFSVWPRPSFIEDDETAHEQPHERPKSRKKSRRQRFKAWQEEKAWDHQVLALTLPSPSEVKVLQVGRSNATLEWITPYVHRSDDDTSSGYRVAWIREDCLLQAGLSLARAQTRGYQDLHGGSPPSDCEREGYVDVDRFEVDRSPLLDGSATDKVTANIQGLVPNATYAFTVRLLLGDIVGMESERTSTARMMALSAPSAPRFLRLIDETEGKKLQWTPSEDDGGSTIESYLVMRAQVRPEGRPSLLESHLTQQGRFDFMEATTLTEFPLKNLLPNASYKFKVAAANKFGVGEWTQETDVVQIQGKESSPGDVHVVGVGHPQYARVLLDVNGGHRRLSASGTPSRLVTINDQEQTVGVSVRPKHTLLFDCWASHHSPRSFNATAELVNAVPSDAQTPLVNAAIVKDRIALVDRGTVPFLLKVKHIQEAGGLGIIIVDDGQCSKFDQNCVPGGDKIRGEGFAALDSARAWSGVQIPVVLVTKDDGEHLQQYCHGTTTS